MTIKRLSDFRGQVGKVCSRIRAAREEIDATAKKRLGDLAVYEQRTIERSFRHGKKTQKQGEELYVFTPGGRKICTVAQFLSGAYRAIGAGSYQKRMWYDSIKAGNDLGRRARRNQVVGGFFEKGTGRFSKKERKNIRDFSRKEITQRQLDREIRRVKAEEARLAEADAKRTEKLRKRREKLLQKREKNESLTRTSNKRIVQRDRHDVAACDVQTHNMYREASKPGEAPRSWESSGNYLRNHVFTREEGDGYIVFLPVTDDGDDILERLEHGGSTERYALGRSRYKQGDLIGYTIVSRRDKSTSGAKFSHMRVSLRKRFAPAQEINVKPRPVFGPAKERVRKKIPTVFKDIQKLLR
jgi:hypothetical protein